MELWGPRGTPRFPCCCSTSKVKCWWGGRGRAWQVSFPAWLRGIPAWCPVLVWLPFPCQGASTEAGGSGPTAIHSSRRMDGAPPVPLDSVLVLVAPPWPCWGAACGEGRTAASGAGAATSFPGPGQLCSSSSFVAWSQARLFVFFLGGKGNIPDAAEWERRLLQVLQPWEA